MLYNYDHGCPSHTVACPRDGTISLGDYVNLHKVDSEGVKTVPGFGNIAVRDDSRLKGKQYSVKATRLAQYWFGKTSGDVLYLKFEHDVTRVLSDYEMTLLEMEGVKNPPRERVAKTFSHIFARPFSMSHHTKVRNPEELKRWFVETLEPLKELDEINFIAQKNRTFDSVESIQTPDRKSWRLL